MDTRGDHIEAIGDPEFKEDHKNAGYYQLEKKYGFVFPINVKQEAIYDEIRFGIKGFIVKKDGLFGLANQQGELMGKIEFDSLSTFFSSAYIAKKKGLYGTFSEMGKTILSAKYKKIIFSDGRNPISFVSTKNSDIQLIFNENEKVFSQKIQYANVYNNLAIVKANGKFGILKNEVILPFEYDSIYVPTNEMYAQNNRAKNTKKFTPYNFEHAQSYKIASVLVVVKAGKLGLINSNAEMIFPPEFDAVANFESFGFYTVKKDNLYGIYFIENKKSTAVEFDRVSKDGVGYIMATKNKKMGVFSMKGEQIVPFEYDNENILQLSGIGFRVSKDKKRGIIDKKGTVLVPAIYDDVDTFYETGFRDFIKVKSAEKYGIVNLKGETIIPVNFEWIGEENGLFKVVTPTPNRKLGLFDTSGKEVIPPTYEWITRSDTENSNITILRKEHHSFNFLNKNNQLIFKENVVDFGYILEENLLLNPLSSNRKYLFFVKNKDGKFGLLNEQTATLDVPFVYDQILQRFETRSHTYYSVRKGKKFGLINEKNEVIIPIVYDDIRLDFSKSDYTTEGDDNNLAVVKKGNKFGTVNFKNQIQIPFEYSDLQRISFEALFKAKKAKQHQILNAKGALLNPNSFDEVANFENLDEFGSREAAQALTFTNGKMRVIDNKGIFLTPEVSMEPHVGYATFDELKFALIEAMDSQENILLKDFAAKIAPSQHLLFYLKKNIFDGQSLEYTNVDLIKETYFRNLLNFKQSYWNSLSGSGYRKTSLTHVTDFTIAKNDVVTNSRNQDHAFGDTRFLEKVLRNAIKVNGFWISTYFMKRGFY